MFLVLNTEFELYDYIRFFWDFIFPPKYARSTDYKQVFWELFWIFIYFVEGFMIGGSYTNGRQVDVF